MSGLNLFPPVPRSEAEIVGMLEVYRSVLPPKPPAWYVSTPLTTGRRLRDLPSSGTKTAEDLGILLNSYVVEPNRREAQAYVRRLRDRVRYVIDPSALGDIDGWKQDDYRFYWGRVIENFVSRVVFRNGWEHSSGCCYEFLTAIRAGVETVDETLDPLPSARGYTMISEALRQGAESNALFLQAVLDSLKALVPDS